MKKKGLLTLSLLFALKAYATMPHIDSLRMEAWVALKRCDRQHAPYWATELEKLDPDQAILYRLAWLEAPPTAIHPPQENSSAEEWAWKQSDELWADERELFDGSCASVIERGTTRFSALPGEIVRAQLQPAIFRYSTARPALRGALRKFALFEWMNGRKLPWVSTQPPARASQDERCEWRALQALHSEKEDLKTLLPMARECTSANHLLWTIVKARAGDLLLKEGRTQAAFDIFQSIVGSFPERKLTKALAYRLAVSGILSHAADDLIFRSVYQAISQEESEEEVLPAPMRSGLANLVCEKFSDLEASSLIKTLRQTFSPGALTPVTLRLTESCSESKLNLLWLRLLNEARSPQDRSRVLGRLLSSAILRNDSSGKTRTVNQIAALSQTSPYLARHVFWSTLERLRDEVPSTAIQAVVSQYRKRATWLPADDLRLKSLMSKNVLHSLKTLPSVLQVSASHSKTLVTLPMAALVEPLMIKDEISSDFTALFEQDLGL